MKHNPRLNERMARLPGLGDIHPLQPLSTVPGAIALIAELSRWLCELTGMPAIAMTPKAGAHGELCGMMAIKAALEARGEKRSVVLVPDSAHGTNPATAALLGYRVESVPVRADGTVDPEEVKKKLSPQVAAIMLTNPNTCGLFERDVVAIAEAVHAAGAYFYADGANFNAIVGKVRPGDLGVDAMHINLHKTFSTPHGGGGPGAGPVALSAALAPFMPVPYTVADADGVRYVEHAGSPSPHSSSEWGEGRGEGQPQAPEQAAAPHPNPLPAEERGDGELAPLGRMCAFHGQMGMFVRALAYMLSHGSDGMRQASEDAVLNANYVRASPRRPDVAALRQPALHARGAVRRPLAGGHGHHHARLRQGHDRRGLSPHDRVLPPGGARRHADRADGIGIQAQPRSSSSPACAVWPKRQKPAMRPASRTHPASPPAAASTRPRPRASRGSGGRRRRRARRQRSNGRSRGGQPLVSTSMIIPAYAQGV